MSNMRWTNAIGSPSWAQRESTSRSCTQEWPERNPIQFDTLGRGRTIETAPTSQAKRHCAEMRKATSDKSAGALTQNTKSLFLRCSLRRAPWVALEPRPTKITDVLPFHLLEPLRDRFGIFA
jgi:hypothetical protein